jgi:hypothetical protein
VTRGDSYHESLRPSMTVTLKFFVDFAAAQQQND